VAAVTDRTKVVDKWGYQKMTAPYPRRLGKFPVTPFLGQ
jgi:hypothetical protein